MPDDPQPPFPPARPPDPMLPAALLDSAIDYAIVGLDAQGIVTSWSAGARHVTGWAPAEAIGQPVERLLYAAEDRQQGVPAAERQRALAEGRATDERWYLRRDGSRFWGSGQTMPLADAQGRAYGFVKILRDRTVQLQAEQQRDRLTHGWTRQLAQLRALAVTSRAIMAATSLDETLDAITQAARQIVGAHQAVVSLTRGADWRQSISAVSLSERYAPWRDYAQPPTGEGIYAWVARTNRPMRLTQAELEAHPLWRGFGEHAADHPPLRGWLAVPLVANDGRNLGLIQLSDKIEGDFDEADESIVMQLAQFAVTAIEQVQTREALRRGEQRLRLALDAAQIGTWELDLQSGALHWDERCKAMFGLPPDADGITYDTFLQGLHPDDRAATDAAVRRALASESARGYDDQFRTIGLRDGVQRWVASQGRTLFEGGRAARFLGTVLDITERRRIEQALRASEERWRGLFERMQEGFYLGELVRDPLSGAACDFRFVQVNPAFEALTGIDPGAAVGRSARALIAGLPDEMVAQYGRAVDTGEPVHFEIHIPSLGERWYEVRASRTEPERFAALFLEITERKRAEQAGREADRRKDEFLAMLAHELRNPLAPLTNAHRLLERGAALGEEARRALAMAQRQTRQLTRLVDDLLEISRISRGKIELRPEPTLVGAVIHDALESVAAAAAARGQRLAVSMPPEPVRIVADPARLAQVLENLLTNAVKYTPEGGSIRVELDAQPAEVELRVSDNGIGVEPHRIPELFEMFTQIDATLDRSEGGLGIGLALVRRLVEMHGGSVQARSAGKGRGTTFIVRLPRAPGVGQAPARPT